MVKDGLGLGMDGTVVRGAYCVGSYLVEDGEFGVVRMVTCVPELE